MSTSYDDTEQQILVCLIAALDDEEAARDMDKAFQSQGDSASCALFIDRFLSEAIEAGLIDATSTWNSEAWQDAVNTVHGDDDEEEEE